MRRPRKTHPIEAMRQAVAQHRAGNPDGARKNLRKVLSAAPDNVDANHLMGLIALQTGHPEAAVRHIAKALRGNPRLAQAQSNLGEAYRVQELYEKAAECYRKAIEMEPGFAGAYNNLGVVLLELDRTADALEAFRKSLALEPGASAALTNLGRAHHARGDVEAAIANHRKAVAANPRDAAALNNLANALQDIGELRRAVECYQKALALNPSSVMAHTNLGVVLQKLGDVTSAIAGFRRAREIEPRDTEAAMNLARTLQLTGAWDEAMAIFREVTTFDPRNSGAYCNLARMLLARGETDEAMALYDKAIAIDPEGSLVRANLGYALLTLGRLDQAVAAYRHAIALDADNAEAHRALAKARRHRELDADVLAMEEFWARDDITDEQRMHLGFGLGKAYEDLHDYEKSFGFILKGNEINRKFLHYSMAESETLFDEIKRVFSPELLARHAETGFGDETPIFIVGMPRSGTSLIEQILASHSKVHGGGELQDLPFVANAHCDVGPGPSFPEFCRQCEPGVFAKLGSDYVQRVRTLAAGEDHVTDKLPYNFIRVGLIRIALPDAKIVHCRREPLDICLSVFKNYFMYGNEFAYDMEELGHFYNLYDDLMAHWHQVLPGFLYDIRYEKLLDDQDGETRRLLDFCGLEFEEACVNFQAAKRAVMTASAAQVRQPIYKDSVALWQRYERQIAPLIEALQERQ